MPAPTLPELEMIARQAGEILRSGFGKSNQVGYKGLIDLVTDVDRQSEAFILSEIQARFPEHHVLAEESGESGGNREHLWYVDPLDGTVNYAHTIPIFCVSLAYAHHDVLQLGVVYAPMLDEMFTAQRGQGAFLNGERLHVAQAEDLDHSLLVTGFPYDVRTNPTNLEYYRRFALRSQGVRRLGSAALDMAYIAAGRFDGYWEHTLGAWDLAAGVLIAEEAGARVTALDGGLFRLTPPISVLAANPVVHGLMLSVLSE
ncbi:MAG: inositol monophosphatase family protein [Anaerolineales bacterium]|jgi:myo-inositol-1(or 4)-monophosphatase